MGFFKELLGDFAKDYLKEKGIAGAVDDIKGGLNNLFSSDIDGSNEDTFDMMWENVGNLVQNEAFDEAENAVIDYYNKYMGGEADLTYYYIRARISLAYYEYLDYNSNQVNDIEKEINDFIKEIKKFNLDSSQKKEVKELLGDFDSAKRVKKDTQNYMARWEDITNKLQNLMDKKQFNQALHDLDNYYNKYEDDKDYWYYHWKFNILKSEFIELNFKENLEEGLKTAKELKTKMSDSLKEMVSKGNEDQQEDIKESEGWVNVFNTTIEIQTTHLLINKKKYNEAREYLNNIFPNKGAEYYQILSRLESLLLIDEIERHESRELVEKTLEASQFNMNLAIELAEGEDVKRNIKESVMSRINRAKEYLETKGNQTIQYSQTLNAGTSNITNSEEQYISELKACYEDGEISDRERRLLNRLRESLGISEERAAELEALCNPNVLSKEEQEYAEEVKVVLEDGVISDRERRLLDRLAKSLNISPERAQQIEESLK